MRAAACTLAALLVAGAVVALVVLVAQSGARCAVVRSVLVCHTG